MNDTKRATSTELAAWREQGREEVIWPEMPILDAHHHLWDHAGDRYLAEEFSADLGDGHNIERTIYVECGAYYRRTGAPELAPLGETTFVLEQAAQLERLRGRAVIAGIIGFADLRLGADVRTVLEEHIQLAGKRFVGVRHATAWDPNPAIVNHQAGPPPGLMDEPSFIHGVQVLGDLGLTYDAWQYHHQLPEIIRLARAAPGTTLVLDHLGAPVGIGPYAGKRSEILAFCRDQLAEFAQAENARLKLGGIGMTLYGNGWHKQPAPPASSEIAAVWGDHIRWCIDTFGPARCLFESNFPPDRRSCSYRTLWNAYKRIAEPYSAAERALLFSDTASAVYGV